MREQAPEKIFIYDSQIVFSKIAQPLNPFVVPKIKMIRRLYNDNHETYSFCFKTGDKYSGEYYYDARIDTSSQSYFTRTFRKKDGTIIKSSGKIELECLDIIPKPKGLLGFTIDAMWTEDSFDWKMNVDATLLEELLEDEIKDLFRVESTVETY